MSMTMPNAEQLELEGVVIVNDRKPYELSPRQIRAKLARQYMTNADRLDHARVIVTKTDGDTISLRVNVSQLYPIGSVEEIAAKIENCLKECVFRNRRNVGTIGIPIRAMFLGAC